MDVLDCVSPQAIALRKDQIRFFAPSSTQRSFMDAILRSTPDTTYLYGSHYSPAREDRIPRRFDPETIVKLAERLKITGLLPVHVFLNLQYSTTGMLQDSTGRPGDTQDAAHFCACHAPKVRASAGSPSSSSFVRERSE